MKIGVNDFVRRQTAESPYSHYEGTFEELAELTERWLGEQEKGYRDGVILVRLPTLRFKSGVVKLTPETKVHTRFAPRREGEAPYLHITATGEKAIPTTVYAVLYSKEVLAENNENSTDADWEIVSLNASLEVGQQPMDPLTMARNFLAMEGGTRGDFSADSFAAAIVYWSDKAMVHSDT